MLQVVSKRRRFCVGQKVQSQLHGNKKEHCRLVSFESKDANFFVVRSPRYGLGGVFSHIIPSGEERSVAFCSRTLNPAETNYSVIEKPAIQRQMKQRRTQFAV